MTASESQRDAAAPGRTKRFRLLEELGAQSRWETAALFLLLVYVAIAPLPYGAITTEGELTLELFAFGTLALLFFDDPKRSEEHTSELQSHSDLVCRLLLEKKKK